MSKLYGSLVIAATTPVVHPLPVLENSSSGSHSGARHKGRWFLKATDETTLKHPYLTESELAMPTRDKHFSITTLGTTSVAVNRELSDQLVELDSKYEGARQLYKLQRCMDAIQGKLDADLNLPYLAVVNNTGTHGWIALLAQYSLLHLYGVYDTVNMSVQLVWTNDEAFVAQCRAFALTRYVFYRFPVIQNRPLFLNTQVLCARWNDWMKSFKNGDAHLRAFNVLETSLYLDPRSEGFGS